jgi:Tfp pilus assembly protein FimT
MTPVPARVLRNSSQSRRGFTLLELMVGLATTAAFTLIATPKITQIFDRAQVKSARTATFNRLMAARLAAQQGGRLAVFRVSPAGLIWTEAQPRLVAVFGSVRDTLGPVTDLPGQYGLSVSSTVDSIVFDPRGLGTGSGTIRFTRGAAADSVFVTGLGSVVR